MSGKPFLDTNVLIYAFAANDPRTARAETLVSAGGAISVQVLNEFVDVCRRKIRLDWPRIDSALHIIADLLDPPLTITAELHQNAVIVARTHGLAFYDSLILSAASSLGCDMLLTEDMQHGQKIGPVTIRNPFR
jgi:predicted nucleic acid-binding protein